MTQNATIVKLLRNLGFPTHDIDGEATDFIFRFRHLGYLLMDNNNDEHFIRMAIPQVFSVTDDNKVMIYGLIERLGYRLKYVKAGISDDEVWIYYEHYVDDETEPSEDLVEHMIRSLRRRNRSGLLRARKFIRAIPQGICFAARREVTAVRIEYHGIVIGCKL